MLGEGRLPKKIKNIFQLKKIVNTLKSQNKKIIFTNGCFDILHIGHIRYLKAAKKLGDILIVGLNSDKSVKKIKGKKRPIFSQNIRKEMLSSLEFVDYIIIFDELTPIKLIKEIKPTLQVKGGDYDIDKIPEKSAVEEGGGKVVIVPYIKGYSTSEIIKKISDLN